MDKIYVGKIVTTHGIKGEVRILSDFQFPEKIFKVGCELIIDDQKYIIKSCRRHKGFWMVTLNDYHDINEVLFLMKKKVYVDKSKLELNDNEVLDEDLVNYKVLTEDGKCGIIKEIFYGGVSNKIMRVLIDNKEVLIPFNSPYMKNISKDKKEVIIEVIE